MTRSDDQRIADIVEACDGLSEVVSLLRAGATSGQVCVVRATGKSLIRVRV
jgi:hypothetical protein